MVSLVLVCQGEFGTVLGLFLTLFHRYRVCNCRRHTFFCCCEIAVVLDPYVEVRKKNVVAVFLFIVGVNPFNVGGDRGMCRFRPGEVSIRVDRAVVAVIPGFAASVALYVLS